MSNKIILLIAGNAGHGKDTFAGFLREYMERWASVRQDAYAYTLKKLAHDSLGIPWEILNADKKTKESTYVYVAQEKIEKTVRQALQDIGEFFRQTFGHRIWASSVRNRTADAPERITIVTDARHPKEEIHWMRESCASLGRVYVVRVRNSRVPVIKGHPSEDLIAAEPDSTFDALVANEADLVHLRRMAFQVASAVVLLSKSGQTKLKKGSTGYVVQCADDIIRYEPFPTIAEADFLADHANDGCQCSRLGHRVLPVDASLLTGSLCGRA